MNANNLFHQIVDLTGIRDLELLEYSLLRTLHQYLQPLDVRIFRLDANGNPRSQIVFGHDKCHVHDQQFTLETEVQDMLEHMSINDTSEFTRKNDSGFLTLYNLHKTLASTLYLQVLNHDRLSRENRHLLLGLLQIFQNYIVLLGENITDPLTGLLNRKSFDQALDKISNRIPEIKPQPTSEDERRHEEGGQFWLVMLDIDHFKQINDSYGHVYGDDVLVLLAQLIRRSFRNEDLIFRFGGEEFVLLIECHNLDGARLALQRLLHRVEHHHFPQIDKVTISAGVVSLDRHTFATTLLDYADRALYHSKQNGRNQVTFFEDMLTAGLAQEQQIEPLEIALAN